MQNIDKIVNGKDLFQQPEYTELLQNKKQFEGSYGATNPEKVKEIAEWTKSWDYREKNLAREGITINPAKACQPLGAVMVALGFENTMPYVHGSHGCTAYFRSYFTRHFKEPTPCVSDSMTEDSAVFGGLNNMKEGLANCKDMYKPEMIAVSTTCMAEVIGDDLGAFISGAKEEHDNIKSTPIPFAHTPSFVGSHITGYDNMLHAVLEQLAENVSKTEKKDRINIVPGFETYIGSIREEKEIAAAFGVDFITLADHSDQWDMGAGAYSMYAGGTKIADAKDAGNSKATIFLQKYSTLKTAKFCDKKWKQTVKVCNPIGLKGTDAYVQALAEVTGKAVPESLKVDRARFVDAIQDSYPYFHGKKFAIWGDPDLTLGLTEFLVDMGAEPVHVLCNNPVDDWAESVRAILDRSPAKDSLHVWADKDLWHMRSLLFTEPVDFMIGNTYGKELMRDTGTPIIYVGFPIFDRHHLHRYSIHGYKGGINLLTWVVNKVLDQLDEDTKGIAKTDYFFDHVR